MRHRLLSLAAVAALLPAPALAGESELARTAEQMRDPLHQEQVASMTETVIALILEMPVGELLQAGAEIAGEDPERIDPQTTLREIAGPGAEVAPRRMAAAVPRVMDAAGGLAGALATAMPQLRRIGDDIARRLPDPAE